MMRIAYLECFSGMSGDMFLGALVDAGVPVKLLEETVTALDVGARLEVSRVDRSGIAASKVDVYAHGEKDLPREVYWEQRGQHGQGHEHGDAHGHSDDHQHEPSGAGTAPEHSHGRSLSEIKRIISAAPISEGAKRNAIAIFESLGAAEAKIQKSGYGAGTRNLPGHANVVRLTIGEAQSSVETNTSQETITVLESNLDDLNPQVVGYVMDRLLEEGALDAFCLPAQMKKNRPGALLTVLCRPEDAVRLTHLVFAETTTLGVRQREERRRVLARRWINVETPWGEVRMKIASMNGTITTYAPEY